MLIVSSAADDDGEMFAMTAVRVSEPHNESFKTCFGVDEEIVE